MSEYWTSGLIKRFNKETKIGVIKQFDGEEVYFHINDIEGGAAKDSEAEVGKEKQPESGQMVHYCVTQTKLGPRAKNVTVLNVDKSSL